ncbi:hypothetical protein POF50_010290 [Streptomyces sp. SL13]|uniref:Uncharacterized protein n=1 Tax=Streptantibioticus silvisoli TaxID=2705255 RepID=A0AA90GX45_9ACTN|nr:hypothetical protein [Streptantibioticus silvisoli]MDI5969723.1 hypothetical protein [Streptantibioticus silvisoli]
MSISDYGGGQTEHSDVLVVTTNDVPGHRVERDRDGDEFQHAGACGKGGSAYAADTAGTDRAGLHDAWGGNLKPRW